MGTQPQANKNNQLEEFEDELRMGFLTVLPRVALWHTNEGYISGDGTYEQDGRIFSSLVGILRIKLAENDKKLVEVLPLGGGAALGRTGDIVTAIVARVSDRGARCELRCSGFRPLARPLRAHLAKENVTDKNKDCVDMYKSFRPGDIILAKILPITSYQSYELTTGEPELGVVIAKASEAPAGVNMIPLSWSEMQCPVTLVKEHRKVARIAPENVYDIMEGKLDKFQEAEK